MSRKFALVIGNTEYVDPGLVQLTAPGNDARDFARVLQDAELCAFDEVRVFVNELSSNITEAIDEFFDQKKPDDLLVLYFSGHGVRDELGALYLACKNTIRTRLRATAIKSDYIREAMDQSRSKRQILILDCCNSGAFPQGTKAAIGGPMGMATALQGYGRYVLMASDATQFAWEGDKVIGEAKDSLFTHFLVQGLTGEADEDGDGKITVDELYDYAYEQIARVTDKQTPTKAASKVEGEFVLRRIRHIEDIKPIPLPPDLIEEVDDTRPYVREVAVQKLSRILEGKNIGMARTALAAMEKIAADDNTTRRVAQTATEAIEAYRKRAESSQEDVESTGAPEAAATSNMPEQEGETKLDAKEAAAPQPREAGIKQARPVASTEARQPAGVTGSRTVAETPRVPVTGVEAEGVAASRVGPARQGRSSLMMWGIAGVAVVAIAFAAYSLLRGGGGGQPSAPPPNVATERPTDLPTSIPTEAATAPPAAETLAPAETAALGPPTPQVTCEIQGPCYPSGKPRIGSPAESMSAWTNGLPTLRDKAAEKYTASDNTSPTVLEYHVTLNASDRVLWEWYWCASSSGVLYKNLSSINLKFELDGKDVSSSVQNANFTNDPWQCRIYFIGLSDWPAGTHHLTTTASITDLVNDGSTDYVPGDYVDDYTVTVK